MKLFSTIAAAVLLGTLPMTAKTTDGVCANDTLLSGFTVYTPADMEGTVAKHGKLLPFVFGNGACSHNSEYYLPMLHRLVRNGYIVVAVGSIDGRFAPERKGGMESIGRDDHLTDAIDWLTAEEARKDSPLHGMVDTRAVAVGGHSCGGAQALAASGHPQVATTLMLNSGMGDISMAGADASSLKLLHGPVLYLAGGPTDIAYGNAKIDFERVDGVKAVILNFPVGHGGTFGDADGGICGNAVECWLDWHMRGDKAAGAYFTPSEMKDLRIKE